MFEALHGVVNVYRPFYCNVSIGKLWKAVHAKQKQKATVCITVLRKY